MPNAYDELEPNGANYVPLSPVSFLERTADIYPEGEALSFKYNKHAPRCGDGCLYY